MITWNNLDTLESFKELSDVKKVNLAEVMTGENGAERVKNYSVPMAAGMAYNYAAKQVDDDVLEALKKLAKEAQFFISLPVDSLEILLQQMAWTSVLSM